MHPHLGLGLFGDVDGDLGPANLVAAGPKSPTHLLRALIQGDGLCLLHAKAEFGKFPCIIFAVMQLALVAAGKYVRLVVVDSPLSVCVELKSKFAIVSSVGKDDAVFTFIQYSSATTSACGAEA